MAGKPQARTALVKDAIARFPQLPTRTLARYLVYNYPGVFESVERARRVLKYYLGTDGDVSRLKQPKVDRVVSMPPTWRQERTPYILPKGKWLCLFDVHIPFHEPRAVEAALAYGKKAKVDGIFLGGDIMDCAAVSYWPSAIKRDLDREIELFIDFLDLLEKEFKGKRIVYKMGNHEQRIPRYLQSQAPALMGIPLATMDAVFGLEARGIDTVDHAEMVMAGRLPILHGHEVARGFSRAVNPARGLFLRAKSWAMCGHFHTTSEHTERSIRNKLLTCWSVGCLSDLSPEYSLVNSWNWGFAIIEHDGTDFFVDNRRILPNGVVA